jgi:hypothetical protein
MQESYLFTAIFQCIYSNAMIIVGLLNIFAPKPIPMREVSRFFMNIRISWKTLWTSNVFRMHFILTFVLFVVITHYCTWYMSVWETRKGILLLDPLLNHLPPHDFSLPIFLLIHSALFLSVFFNLDDPKMLLKAFQGYALLLIVRTICIYLIPLETPRGMIYLRDPFIAMMLNHVNVVTKDLFFSGHISSMCLFIYFSHKRSWRTYLKFATPVLAALILWQHVHYTVDIIAAPFFAFACCKLTDILNERWEYGMDRRLSQG